jgi:hypothetical protein
MQCGVYPTYRAARSHQQSTDWMRAHTRVMRTFYRGVDGIRRTCWTVVLVTRRDAPCT